MDDQAPLVGKGAEAVGENLPDSRNTSPANYTSLFAWQPSVQPGALNDNTGSIAYLHEIYSLAMSLETGANPGLIRPLQGRRPDIGSLSMDEIGLKQVLPSLRLVIEQLTAQVRQRAPSASVEQTLALADPSATQPFHAAWEQIKAVLRQRKVSLWEVLRKSDADYPNFTFGNNTSAALRAAMTLSSGLSPELRTALTAGPETARHTVEALKARARQRANVPGEAPKSTAGMFLSKEDRLRRCLGLSRKQLRQMLAVYEPGDGVDQGRSAVRDSAFVTRASAATSATFGARIINQGKAPLYLTAASQGYVSPSGERPVTVKGATEPHYDRMVRMLRLHRATGLSFGDLDMLLASAMTAEGQQDTDFHITPATLRALGLFQHLREAYGVTAPQFTTFIGDMPTCSNGREPAFYDTLFNPSQTSNRESIVLQIDGAAFDPMALEGPDAQTVAQLAQAMKVDEATVRWALARIVAAQNLETPTRSVAVVSACYRLLVMPQVFGIKARELRTFLTALNRFTPIVFEQLAGTPSLATPATAPTIDDADADADADADDTTILDVVAMVMNTAEWAVGHHLDVGVLCALVQAPEPAPVPTRWIEAATRAMEQHDAGDSTTTTGDDTKIDRNDAAVRLAFQQAFQLTDTNLANPLLAWAGVTVEQFIASLGRLRRPAGTTAIHAVPVTGEDVAMWQEIEKRVVAALLFRLSAAGLAAITSHPAWFNIEGESGEGMRPLDFTTLYQLTRYRDWIAGLPQVAGKVGGEDQAHEYLTKVNTDRALTQAQTAAMLARLTGWDLGDIESITDYIDGKTVPGTAEDLRDIDLIMRLHDLARATRVGIDALLDINDLKNDADDASLATAAAALWGGCRAEEALAVEGTHNEAYRDALVGWLIEHGVSDGAANPSTLYVTDVSELSDHLLLDVMTGREPQTSRVAASIASVQTYIHRILTRLEPGHDDNATATADVRERWTNAQSSYGRWQLLAKMRNYPENYLDPTRRRGKTSHYADLENLLAQGKLSESDIQSALFDYLTKFEASANIQPLTAYHDGVDPLHDTYHIIGKSNVSPSGYFWRTLDMSLRAPDDTTSTLGFSEWEPMSVVPTGTITQTTLPARGSRATFASADDKVDFTQEALAEDSRNMIDTIRPVVIDNQRYAVWVERDTTGIPMGSEQKTSPFFELRLCYSVRKLDGLWSVPNVLKTLNGYDDDMTYQGTEENVTSPPAVPDVDAAKSRATTNLSLKTKDFSPGLIVMVNAKGHRKNDPWLTVVLFRSNGALTSLEAGDDYYIASWDKLFLEERSLDTDTTTTGATNADASITAASRANLVEKALVTDWLALFSDPRIVQHQYVGKIMTLAELERDKRAYRIITDAAAKRVTDSYDTRLSRAGTGSLEGGLDDRQDFLELTATFDGAWMPSQDGGPATAVKNEAMAGVVEVSGSEASDVEIFEGSATVDGIAIKMSMPNTVLDATPVTTEWDIPLGEFPSRVKKLRLRLDDVYLIESTLNAPSPNVTKTVHHGSIYGVFHRLAAITILVGFVNQTDQFRIVKVTLTRKKANAIKPTEKSTKPGSARLVLRGGVADSVGTDQPKKISLTHEDELVMARPEFAGIKAFVEGNSEASVAFRSALAVSRRPGSVVTERVKVSHWYDFLMSEYEYTEKEHKRTASELIQAEADALKASIAVVPVPATVDIRQAVALKRHHPETFARFMASAMVGEQVLAEQTFVLDGAPCQIAARFPVNLDIAKYAFTLEVYANEDTDILGRVIRLYELQEPAKDDRDDRAPTTRLIRNGYQAHYLDMTEVKGKIAVAAQRRNAIRLNTLFAKRLAALSFVSAHHAMGWEAQLIVEPRLEPGGEQALVDFRGANGLYFWELFFHVPMLLAWQLRGTRQFREAFDWCARHLFDPYDTVGRSEVYEPPFWHTRPLVDVAPNLAAGESTSTEDVEDHAYAEPERYRKAVFMFLVECWRQQGDDLYRQLTRDGVNEAVDRYRMALRLIGPLPEAQTVSSPTLGSLSGVKGKPFLPPVNVALTQARDLLHHRLFNIRHGLTIDGRVMDLDLYDSADDHASLGDARTGMTSGSRRVGPLSVPPYRFRHVLPLAKDAVATLVDMGRQLFHTYEEEYNAGLSVLQQANLIKLSDFTVELEMQNIAAARAEHDTLLATRRMVEQRRDYYNKLDNDGHYDNETAATSLVAIGKAFTLAAVPFDIVAANVAMFPKIFGLANGGANPEFGPLMTGEVLRRVGETQIYIADELRWQAAFERGRAGWRHEASQAERELEIIDRQMAENDIRMRSANVTLANEKSQAGGDEGGIRLHDDGLRDRPDVRMDDFSTLRSLRLGVRRGDVALSRGAGQLPI
jgi:hypothetical protein